MKCMYECTYYEMHVQYDVMKCMHDCNYCEMYAWMHDVVQKDEISMHVISCTTRDLLMHEALLEMHMML